MHEELEEEFNLSSIFDEKEEIIEKIIDNNCNREKFNKWLEDTL